MFHTGEHMKRHAKKGRHLAAKVSAVCVSLLFLLGIVIGGTIAWMTDVDMTENQYSVGQVSCEIVKEAESNTTAVKNTSSDTVYIRVRLIGYQKDAEGHILGGTGLPTDLPIQTGDWLQVGAYYYCTAAIESNASTPVLLDAYQPAEGQWVEVLAEAIQGKPVRAVESAWTDISVSADGTLVAANKQ